MEEIMNQGFEFIVPNNFERNPPTNQKFLRMALAIVDNVNCRMYDNDDRICFGIPMEGYYMTEVITFLYAFKYVKYENDHLILMLDIKKAC